MSTWRKVSAGRPNTAATLRRSGNKKVRKRRRLDHRAAAVIITVAEADHLTIGEMPMKIERLERQRAKLARERLLLVGGQNAGMVAEPLRQAGGRARTDRAGLEVGVDGGRMRSCPDR